MTTKEQMLALAAAVEHACREAGCPPMLFIVLLPESNQFVRLCSGLEHPQTQLEFADTIRKLFVLQTAKVLRVSPAELEQAEAAVEALPVCPACLGQGCQHLTDVPGAEPVVCVHCKGTGRITP